MNILEAMDHEELYAPVFQGDWLAWRTYLAAKRALKRPTKAMLAIYRECTGRTTWPTRPARESYANCGRRSRKTQITAFEAHYEAWAYDYRPLLAPGDWAVIPILACDRTQATIMFNRIAAFFELNAFKSMLTNQTKDTLELGERRVLLQVRSADFRRLRGPSVAHAKGDEVGFWRDETGSSNPAEEIFTALRPALLRDGTISAISTGYSRSGPLWTAYRDHWAKEDDPVFVWTAPTTTMAPEFPREIIEAAIEADPQAAEAEWLGGFRRDLENFVSREVIDACVVPGRHELPPSPDLRMVAFTDPAGGSGGDSFTLALAYQDRNSGQAVLTAVREAKPPFSPEAVVTEFSSTLKAYGCASVMGDAYSGAWVREAFERCGVRYEVSPRPKSALYLEALPLLNAHKLELLDHPKLLAQIGALERRTARSGKDSVDHPPKGHDDIANAALAACVLAHEQQTVIADFSINADFWKRNEWAADSY